MGKSKLILAGLVTALALGAGSILFYASNPGNNQSQNNQTTTQQSEKSQNTKQEAKTEQQAKLTSSEEGKKVSYEGQDGQTALAVLKSLAEVETKQSNYGEFVVAINGVKADGTTQFWAFYVNGKLADEGAGTYSTKDGDKIEWRVEDVTQQ
jgi:hypothetical protein